MELEINKAVHQPGKEEKKKMEQEIIEAVHKVLGARINRSPEKPFSDEDAAEQRLKLAQAKADRYNASKGDLPVFDCPECLNRGYFAYVEKGFGGMIYERFRPCKCMEARKAHNFMLQSGLSSLLEEMTFDRYKCTQPFQTALYDACRAYADALHPHKENNWLFLGGESGAGKTHLCTAVCAEAMKKGIPVRYMLWEEALKPIRSNVNDAEEYQRLLNPYKSADLLYIDDLFKPVHNKNTGALEPPTPAEAKIAYELLNHRVIHKRTTIISCEWYLAELIDIDAAIGGRIKQKAGPFALTIGRDKNKNYRLKGDMFE